MSLKRALRILSLGGVILSTLLHGYSYADYGIAQLEQAGAQTNGERTEQAEQAGHIYWNQPRSASPISRNMDTSGASYRLGGSDKIKITVYGEPDLSGIYLVNEEGYISFPLVDEVKVKDLTIIEARHKLHAKLSDGFLIDPNIAIEVAEFRPIYVMGEVREPGSYDFRTDMSVRNAVAIAGGFTYRADQKEVKVTRQLKDNETVNITLGKDGKIHPGDVIMVEERFF